MGSRRVSGPATRKQREKALSHAANRRGSPSTQRRGVGTLLSTRWLQKEAPPGSRHTLLEGDGVCEWFPGPLICPENRLSLAPAPWVSSGQIGGCETWLLGSQFPHLWKGGPNTYLMGWLGGLHELVPVKFSKIAGLKYGINWCYFPFSWLSSILQEKNKLKLCFMVA